MDVERIIKNVGMVGKNPRMKEASMNWLVQVKYQSLPPSLREDLYTDLW
jgi:CLIP-associating protein 1/2